MSIDDTMMYEYVKEMECIALLTSKTVSARLEREINLAMRMVENRCSASRQATAGYWPATGSCSWLRLAAGHPRLATTSCWLAKLCRRWLGAGCRWPDVAAGGREWRRSSDSAEQGSHAKERTRRGLPTKQNHDTKAGHNDGRGKVVLLFGTVSEAQQWHSRVGVLPVMV
jgi:hypothetical protein